MCYDFPMTGHEASEIEPIPGGVALLQSAYKTLQLAELPAELAPAAFEAVLGLAVGSDSAPFSPAGVGVRPAGVEGAETSAGGGRLGALAAKLGLESERVAQVFYEEDEQLLLGLPASRFGSRKADAARRISLLVTLGRQFDGQEQWTPVAVLREACQEYNAFDVGNFARTVLTLGDVLQFQGNGQQRRVRLTKPGLEKGAEFITELTS